MADEQNRSPRTPRTLTTREETKRRWAPPSLLPEPTPQDGYVFRWVRISMAGANDATNMSGKLRQGYEPVRAEDHPELGLHAVESGKFKGCIENGGLLLCKIPQEFVQQRNDYYQNKTRQETEAVDNSFMRENDPRMPLLAPERKTKVSFGSGN